MAIYRFSFDPRYAGHTATVTNSNGAEVTGSPATLDSDGDCTLDLTPTGFYRAQVSNAEGWNGDGYSVVDGVLDVPASLDTAGGGPILVGQSYTVYANNGFVSSADRAGAEWDTPGDLAYDAGTHDIILPTDGIYTFSYELDYQSPPEGWRWYTQIFSQAVLDEGTASAPAIGDLLPGGGSWTRSAIFGGGALRVSGERRVRLVIELEPDPAAETPTRPNCTYGQLDILRIA